MTYTLSDLTNLKAALLSGATSISVNGRTVTFRTMAELKSLIADVEVYLAAQVPGCKPNPRRIKARFSKW